MKPLKFFVFCSLIFSVCFMQAQDRQLGTWRSYMSYSNAYSICDAVDKVYVAGANTVFSYEKNTGVIQTYDKSTGLSDISVSMLNYDAYSQTLVVAYNNSNIDLIVNGTDIYNIPDIKNKSSTGSLVIHGIAFNSGKCYVASDIGISVINLTKREISNTYIIGAGGAQIKVYSVSFDTQNIYAATQEGVKHAALNSANLQNFNSWILFPASLGMPNMRTKYVAAHAGNLYAVITGINTDTLYKYDGVSWQKIFYAYKNTFKSFYETNGNLFFSVWNDSVSAKSDFWKIDVSGSLIQSPSMGARSRGWFESSGNSYSADEWNGFMINKQGDVKTENPSGPYRSDVFSLNIYDDAVYVSSGGADESWGNIWNYNGVYVYKDHQWSYFNGSSDAVFSGMIDFLSTAVIPFRNKTYFGSFFNGLVERDNQWGILTVYDKTNSLLEGATGDSARTKISALAADKRNNLWIGNAYATKPLKLIRPDGSWHEFTMPYHFDLMKKIVVDENDQLWMPLRGSSATGILVWSYNETIANISDDKARLLRAGEGQGGLPDNVVYCVVEDKDKNIWAGTNQGIGVFYCPGSVLNTGGCDADQIKVERDGYIGYLFGTESVRAIAVDAANRKWVGTTNGVWLISADGKTELLKFNSDNSPLPANQITDIAIDPKTGEVFIGTIAGLVSYQGDAIEDCGDCDEALVYPNPVKPDYTGPIAIKGLAQDAYVKITDISGTLVYQGKANGTQMIWDGNGYKGERAKSGVYLVFSSTDLGKEKRVAKILLMN